MLWLIVIITTSFAGSAFAGTANLTWSNPAPISTQSAATGNKVYRSTSAAVCDAPATGLNGLTLLATIPTAPASGTFVDPNVPDVTGKVCYEVTSFNDGGESARSNRVTLGTTVNPSPAPTDLKAVIVKP